MGKRSRYEKRQAKARMWRAAKLLRPYTSPFLWNARILLSPHPNLGVCNVTTLPKEDWIDWGPASPHAIVNSQFGCLITTDYGEPFFLFPKTKGMMWVQHRQIKFRGWLSGLTSQEMTDEAPTVIVTISEEKEK